MIDHAPHSYEQLAHAFEGHPEGGLTRDAILDNITLYWVTNTGTSAARLYWEFFTVTDGIEISPEPETAAPSCRTPGSGRAMSRSGPIAPAAGRS